MTVEQYIMLCDTVLRDKSGHHLESNPLNPQTPLTLLSRDISASEFDLVMQKRWCATQIESWEVIESLRQQLSISRHPEALFAIDESRHFLTLSIIGLSLTTYLYLVTKTRDIFLGRERWERFFHLFTLGLTLDYNTVLLTVKEGLGECEDHTESFRKECSVLHAFIFAIAGTLQRVHPDDREAFLRNFDTISSFVDPERMAPRNAVIFARSLFLKHSRQLASHINVVDLSNKCCELVNIINDGLDASEFFKMNFCSKRSA